jgi:lysophospholipase L1-like esterase
MEYAADTYLRSNPSYVQTFIRLNAQPLMEYAPETKASPPYHFRRNAYSAKNISWHKDTKGVIGKAFFSEDEGMIRNSYGDHVINKWGYRGPYFEKQPPSNVYRIAIAGGSTTAGQYDNELTYPRILERMLNNKSNSDKYYEVINSGHYWYNACDVRNMIKRELYSFKPNLVLIMSGWNDLNRLRNDSYKSRDQYCDNHNTFIDRFSLKLLLKLYKDKIFPPSEKKHPYLSVYDINEKSFSFYEDNFHEIIKDAKERGIDIGLISLTSAFEKGHNQVSMEEMPQLSLLEEKYRAYKRDTVIRIDNFYKRLAKTYSNVFYINTGATVNSKGKELYFNDSIHGTGAGYKIHAYGIYKSLNKRLKIHPYFNEEPQDEKVLEPEDVEVEYIKSLFAANKFEDFSYSTCMVLHHSCTHRDRTKYHLKNKSIMNAPGHFDREYVTSVIEFVMGTLIHFGDDNIHLYVKELIEDRLSENIKMRPNLSLNYWVTGQYHRLKGKRNLAETFLLKAYKLNPKLKDINFDKYYQQYRDNRIENVFTKGLLTHIIKILKKGPNYFKPYYYFNILSNNRTKEEIKMSFKIFGNFYYSSPLLMRSTFMEAAKLHVQLGEIEQAKNILQIIKTFKPNFKDSIDKYQKELLKES